MKKILYTALAAFTFVLFSGCSEDLEYLKRENYFLGSYEGSTTDKDNQLKAVDLGLSVKWSDRLLSTWAYNAGINSNPLMGYNTYSFGASSYDLNSEGIEKGDISGTNYDNVVKAGCTNWRTPTKENFEELITKCTLKFEENTIDGTTYRGFRAIGPNGNSIFIRAEYNTSSTIYILTSSYYSTGGASSSSRNYYGYKYKFSLYYLKDTVESELISTFLDSKNCIWPVTD